MNKRRNINTKIFLLVYDSLLTAVSFIFSYILINISNGLTFRAEFFISMGILLVAQIGFEILFRLHRCVWSYSSPSDYIKLALAAIFSICLTLVISMLFTPLTLNFLLTYLVAPFIIIVATFFPRFIRVYVYERSHRLENQNINRHFDDRENLTLIIGGGWTGNMLIKEFRNNSTGFSPVCILDDDRNMQSMTIQEIPVVGTTYQIIPAVRKYKIKKIIFAIPSCGEKARKRILDDCIKTGCLVRIVPPLHKLVLGSNIFAQTDTIKIEDLLGREPIKLNDTEVATYVNKKICMVTGGGGSIGSELCRQIAGYKPQKLIIVDIYENNAYDIQQELLRKHSELDLAVEICSVTDYDKMKLLFEEFKPDIVFHAAAHKHVPLMETVPEQAVKNNVMGTYNVCKLCSLFKIDKMIFISTDKAVNPTNVMGATKRCCEMIVKYFAQLNGTKFCLVRFGNVLGSNGSVIPLFKKQIESGGPVSVTDKDITRFFMTIPEAVSLVLRAGAIGLSGETFILDMGTPVKILTLAENMIRLSGFEPYKDIKIKFVGLRPGEKLYEELLLNKEIDQVTKFEKIYISKQETIDEKDFMPKLHKLFIDATNNDVEAVLSELQEIVPTFNHNKNQKLIKEMA